jgi:Putative glycosyl/glycerophosphate transferases involved in teichoic acid biosynthesis TagF/TagB/EpsJ/RodC
MKIIRKLYMMVKFVLMRIALIFPLKERIVAESFLGNRNDDNIYYFLKNYDKKIKVYYVQKKHNKSKQIIGKRLIKNTFKYVWYMHTSKIILVNSRLHHGILKKRKNQIVIQMWHGAPWKKLVYDQDSINFSHQTKISYLDKFSEDIKKWDYLWVPNQYAKNKLTTAFRYSGKYIESMYPAETKMLSLENNIEYINDIKTKLNLDLNKKIVVYMPTFRENKLISSGKYEYFSSFDIQKFAESNPNYIFLIRTHYLVYESKFTGNNVYDVSEYSQVIDLYLISDILITDYSSAIYSFSLLKKPIISVQIDIPEYQNTRGLYEDGIVGMNIIEVKTKTDLNELCLETLDNSIPKKDFFDSYSSIKIF